MECPLTPMEWPRTPMDRTLSRWGMTLAQIWRSLSAITLARRDVPPSLAHWCVRQQRICQPRSPVCRTCCWVVRPVRFDRRTRSRSCLVRTRMWLMLSRMELTHAGICEAGATRWRSRPTWWEVAPRVGLTRTRICLLTSRCSLSLAGMCLSATTVNLFRSQNC